MVSDNPPERLHDLDALRGFAMVLGIVLHASLAYFPVVWHVQDPSIDGSTWVDELEYAIHGFRMPLFFLLSGFFTTMLWRRRGLHALAMHRAKRVLVPLIIAALTIAPLMDWVSERAGNEPTDFFSLHHLWFLRDLIVMMVGFVAVAFVLERIRLPFDLDRLAGLGLWALIPFAFVPHYWMAEAWGLFFGPATNVKIEPDPSIFVYYSVFFTFGALAYGRRGPDGRPVVRTVGQRWPVTLSAAVVLFFVAEGATHTDDPSIPVSVALQVVYVWLAIFGLMGLFHRLLGEERRGVRYLSDSTYWLYLAHLPIVVVLQDELQGWAVAGEVKFVVITVVTTIILLVTYQAFVRYTPIGTLLNGPRTPTRVSVPWAKVPVDR